MADETRPGELSRSKRHESPVTFGDMLKIASFVITLFGAGGVAAYVELKRNTDKVEMVQADMQEIKATQRQQQSQLTNISQDQAVQTYRLVQLEKK